MLLIRTTNFRSIGNTKATNAFKFVMSEDVPPPRRHGNVPIRWLFTQDSAPSVNHLVDRVVQRSPVKEIGIDETMVPFWDVYVSCCS
jgi:hypothetical protein